MILADTNVISETLRGLPNGAVAAWLDRVPQLRLAAPVLSELLLGVALLPDGARKVRLSAAVDLVVKLRFPERALPFDADAAHEYARLVAQARRSGRAIAVIDGQIAAIALSRGATVATRDTAPFEAAGVPVINPWLSA